MSSPVRGFGRRPTDAAAPPPPLPQPSPTTPVEPVMMIPRTEVSQPNALEELRAICLSRLDPTIAAATTPDRLQVEVERLLAEIADGRHIQLNGREQRQLAGELVDDMLGLGPLEPLLDDHSITDIMVNGPDRVFVEQRGKILLSSVRFRDAAHAANIAQRIAAAVGRRVDESSPMVDARLA